MARLIMKKPHSWMPTVGFFVHLTSIFFKHLASAANLPLQIRSAGQSVSLAPPSMPC
jgi:hypothetical protein